MKKFLFSIGLFTIFNLLFAMPAAAAGTTVCQPIYGGGQTCAQFGPLSINKMVSHPQTGVFVENLGVNDPKFSPDQPVNFQITVTNTGPTTLGRVVIRDILPSQVVFVSGPGSFDANTKNVSFEFINLNPGESRTQVISTKVVLSNQLPQDKVINCEPVNQSFASADNVPTSADNASFCIQLPQPGVVIPGAPVVIPGAPGVTVVPGVPSVTKGGLKVFPPPSPTTTPPTGPEALALFALLPSGFLGAFIRKKAGLGR